MKTETKVGEQYGYWKVIEANVINPNTKAKGYIGKPRFSLCQCTQCNTTTRYFRNNELKYNTDHVCKNCSNKNKFEKIRTIQIGDKFGKLTVIDDGGVIKDKHYSKCQCECGNIINVRDAHLKNGNTKSCGCIRSKGEMIIQEILDNNNIIYDRDSIFPELLQQTGRKLRFDFIIYNEDGSINRFIEFDGNQHKTGMWGGSWSNIETLDIIKERDNIKNKFCIDNNYILVRLPYHTIKNMTLEKIMGYKYIYKEEDDNE